MNSCGTEDYCTRCLLRLKSRCLVELRTSEGLTGAGESAPSVAHLTCPAQQSCPLAGDFSFPTYGPLSRAAWVSSQHGSWLLPELVVQERTKQKPEYFYDLGTKIIHDHFCNIQLVTSTEMRGYRSLGASVILVPPLLLYSIKYFTIGSQRFYFFICVRVYVHKLFSCVLY